MMFFHIAFGKNCLSETEALSLQNVAYGSLFNCNQLNSRDYPNSQPPAKLTPGSNTLFVKNEVASRCLLVS